jgi:hypothetical protein
MFVLQVSSCSIHLSPSSLDAGKQIIYYGIIPSLQQYVVRSSSTFSYVGGQTGHNFTRGLVVCTASCGLGVVHKRRPHVGGGKSESGQVGRVLNY